MLHISIDLELAQPSGKIIQVGACIGNLHTGEVVDTMCILVDPDEPLTDYIVNLTGITDYQLQSHGVHLTEAYSMVHDMLNRYPETSRNALTWGFGDSIELERQLGIPSGEGIFARREFDVKTIYQMQRLKVGAKVQAGLAKAMTRYGLRFKGRKHNALDDAINTFNIMVHLLRYHIV